MRKDEWRALDTQGRKAIKGLRWLLSMHSRNRTKGHTRFLNSLRNSNRRIHRVWVLKDKFEHIWNYSYRASAEKFLSKRLANCIYPGPAGVAMMSSPSIDIPRTQHEFKLIQKRSQPPALV